MAVILEDIPRSIDSKHHFAGRRPVNLSLLATGFSVID
jgi:hypothetical protein